MTISSASPIFGPPSCDLPTLNRWAVANNAGGEWKTYLPTLYTNAISAGVDPLMAAAQWAQETSVNGQPGRSDYFANDGNPVGIGIWKGGVPSPWTGKLSGVDSANVHIAELLVHTKGVYPGNDPAWYKRAWEIDSVHLTKVRTLRHSVAWPTPNVWTLDSLHQKVGAVDYVWAADQAYALGIAAHMKAILAYSSKNISAVTHSADVPVLIELTPWSNANRNGGKLDLTRGGLDITIHDTANYGYGADALMHSTWQDGSDGVRADVSVTFYVDDKRIVQKLPLDEISYHAGDGCNDIVSDVGCFRSCSIEMCVNSNADHEKVAQNCAQLVARIANNDPAFDWGDGKTEGKYSINRIVQHIAVSQEVPPHDCPHSLRYADYGTDWNEWLQMVDVEWVARTIKAPTKGDYSRKVSLPPVLTKLQADKTTKLPSSFVWKKVVFTLVNAVYIATKETPVLKSASRKSLSTRRPLTVHEKARILYTFSAAGETWGLTQAGSRIPLRDMRLLA